MNRSPDAVFIGWQKTSLGYSFPLFNIVKAGHPSFGSTVTEMSLRRLDLTVPTIPLRQSEKVHSIPNKTLATR